MDKKLNEMSGEEVKEINMDKEFDEMLEGEIKRTNVKLAIGYISIAVWLIILLVQIFD